MGRITNYEALLYAVLSTSLLLHLFKSRYSLQHLVLKLTLLATCFHDGFLLGLFFDPEDGGDMFLRNVS
jgi:hypothetical protein